MACSRPFRVKVPGHKELVTVPCRWCTQCRIDRRFVLQTRIEYEVLKFERMHRNSTFATVTYDDPHLPRDGSLKREHARKFMHRLREYIKRNDPPLGDYKYVCVGEYGGKLGRPHYHLILIGIPLDKSYFVAREWPNGTCDLKPLMPGGIRYVIKYVDKQVHGKLADEIYGDMERPFLLQSRGIGLEYMMSNLDHMLQYEYINKSGTHSSIPHYYRDKLSRLVNQPMPADSLAYYKSVQLQASNNNMDPQLYALSHALAKETSFVHASYRNLGSDDVIESDYLSDLQERVALRSRQLTCNPHVANLAKECI